MPRSPSEVALYEAVFDGKAAGHGPEFAADRERIGRWVDRLNRAGWAIVPADGELTKGSPVWLDRLLAKAADEGDTVDALVSSWLDDDGEAHDAEDCDRRIADLEALLERNDIEVPEW